MKDQQETLFEAALKLTDAQQRAAFLEAACQGNPDLRRRLDDLLAAQPEADVFFQKRLNAEGPTVMTPVTERPGDRIGRYKLLQQIGEGGCGVVYMAEQEEPVRRRVALKVIKLGMDTKNVIARFEAERQALALMDHPNIAKVLDAGATETGRPFFVMELVRGIRITEYCDQNNLSTRERLDLFIQVCHALQHAHQKGIIHRDIKPSNILVSLHDGVPVPVVIDFGIAKATEQKLTDKTLFTAFEQFIGTPAYTSPEQAEMSRLDVDTRSDIYALGVLLYELLTGQTPFDAKELMAAGLDEMRRTIREKEPARPSTRLSSMLAGELTTTAQRRQADPPGLIHLLRGDLDWIVMKCLEKDRTRRYETANGLAQDILHHLNNEPVAARPPSTAYRFQKFVRRNKMTVAAGSAVGLALVLGVVVSSWQAFRATRARRDEAAARLRADEAARVAEGQRERAENEAQKSKESELAARHNLYVANMNLTQQAWEQNNVGQVRRLLEETATYPECGFEWYYWQRQTHQELQTLRGHPGGVLRVTFSPDGQRIATASHDQTAKVWDAASGKELLTLRGHSAPVSWLAFSPDGRKIITGSFDQTAKVWDATNGEELRTLKGHMAAVSSVAVSPNGRHIVTGSLDRTAKVWEAANGRQVLTLNGHSDYVWSVAFSPDGQRIVTGSKDAKAKLWDAASGQELASLEGHRAAINVVAFSPDGQRIVTCSRDGTTRLWEAVEGKWLPATKGSGAEVWGVNFIAFSPNGQRIVAGSTDQTAKVWEAFSSRELLTLKGHGDAISSAAFSPDGQRIVTGSADMTAKVWDATAAKEPLVLRGHNSAITSVAFSPDGRQILTGSFDRTARVWDAASGERLLSLDRHGIEIWSVAYSPNGRRIVAAGWNLPARVWDAASGEDVVTLKGPGAGTHAVAFSPDGRRIVTGGEDQTARVWDAAAGGVLFGLEGHHDTITSVAFSPDGRQIVTGSADRTAKVWDATGGKELLPLEGHGGGVTSVAYSPDGRRIVTGSRDRRAMVWDAATGKELFSLKGHKDGISSVVCSPDGQRIVTGSADMTAKVWDATSGRELLTLRGHTNGVSSVAFSADGQRIVAGSWDGTAKVWEAASVAQVTSWRQGEQAAADRLGAQERRLAATASDRALRAQDQGSVKQWLVLLPITFQGQSGARALQEEQVAGEGQLSPRAGQRTQVGQAELVWRAVQLQEPLLDFNRLAGGVTEWSVAYAVTYIRSEAAQSNVVLKLGSNDQCGVYLNGSLLHQWVGVRAYSPDEDVVAAAELKAGINVLVFKVVNELGMWQGSVRLTDAAGHPLKGIRVTLDPDAKD